MAALVATSTSISDTDRAAGTASTDADTAVATVVALAPESTRPDITQVRDTAEAALADADTALGISTDPTDPRRAPGVRHDTPYAPRSLVPGHDTTLLHTAPEHLIRVKRRCAT